MATTQERIDAINLILDRGLSKVTDQDGRSHDYDLEALERQRDKLQLNLNRNGSRGPSLRHGVYNPGFYGE